MHIVTIQTPTVSLALMGKKLICQTDVAVMQVFTKRICQSILDTKLHIYIHDMYFSHICHFGPMTQSNPLKTQIFDPFPTQPNPTQPNPRVNPTHGQLWSGASLMLTRSICSLLFTRSYQQQYLIRLQSDKVLLSVAYCRHFCLWLRFWF